VSRVYVYALLDARPSGALPSGLQGERLRTVQRAGVVAVVGDVPAGPEVEAAALRAHDATAVAVAEGAAAVLPARFGAVLDDEAALARFLDDHEGPLREALQLVRGCRQMTLRLSSAAGRAPARPPDPPAAEVAAGPGKAYLEARAAREPHNDARVRAVVAPLEGLVRATRVEGHDHPPLVASVYHLVPIDRLDDYRAALAAATQRSPGVHVSLSGPWLPYAFAPGLA
jgi:hypothetical protein